VYWGDVSLDPQLRAMATVFEIAGDCAHNFGLDPRTTIRPRDLLDLEHRWSILHGGFCGGRPLFPASRPPAMPAEHVIGKRAAVLLAVAIPIEKLRLVCAFALTGVAQYLASSGDAGPEVRLDHGEVRPLWKHLIRNQEWSRESLAVRL